MRFAGYILTAALGLPLTLAGQSVPQHLSMSSQSPQLSLPAQHFLNLIASEDQSEINLAKLALKKSSNAQIRHYAQSKILAADPSMKQNAMKIAHQYKVPIDGSPTSADKAEFYYLSKLSGKEFDKAYMNYEDAQQASDLIQVQNEAAAAKNQQLKQYAQKEATPVQQAAQSAKSIAQAIGS